MEDTIETTVDISVEESVDNSIEKSRMEFKPQPLSFALRAATPNPKIEDTDGGGLGINFYDHKGASKRSRESDVKQVDGAGSAARAEAAVADFIAKVRTPTPTMPLFEAQTTPKAKAKAKSDVPTSSIDYEGIYNTPLDKLLDDTFEELNLDQAEWLSRTSRCESVEIAKFADQHDSRYANSNIENTGVNTTNTHPNKPSTDRGLSSIHRTQSLRVPKLTAINQPRPTRNCTDPVRAVVALDSRNYTSSNGVRSGSDSTIEIPTASATYGSRITSISNVNAGDANRGGRKSVRRGSLYFTEEERIAVTALIFSKERSCSKHKNCLACIDLQFAYQYYKAMPASIPLEERQRIIEINRSLRTIKNVGQIS